MVGSARRRRAPAWLRHPLAVAAQPGQGRRGRSATPHALARHRVPVRRRTVVVAAHGDDRVEAVTVVRLGPRRPGGPGQRATGRGRPGRGRLGLHPAARAAARPRLRARTRRGRHAGRARSTTTSGRRSTGCSSRARRAASAVPRWRCSRARSPGVGGGRRHRAGRVAPTSSRLPGRSPRRCTTRTRCRTRWTDRVTDDTLVCRCEEVTAGAAARGRRRARRRQRPRSQAAHPGRDGLVPGPGVRLRRRVPGRGPDRRTPERPAAGAPGRGPARPRLAGRRRLTGVRTRRPAPRPPRRRPRRTRCRRGRPA